MKVYSLVWYDEGSEAPVVEVYGSLREAQEVKEEWAKEVSERTGSPIRHPEPMLTYVMEAGTPIYFEIEEHEI